MLRRVERKEFRFSELIRVQDLFTRSRIPFWIWFVGTGCGIFLTLALFSSLPFHSRVGILVVTQVFICILSVAILHFYPEFLSGKHLLLSAIILIGTTLMGRIVMSVPQIPDIFIPVAFLSILFSLFFNIPLSILALSTVCILFAFSSGEFQLLPVWFCGGMAGVYGASIIHHRTDITRVGFWVGVVNISSFGGVGLLENFSSMEPFFGVLWGLGSGIFSSILVNITLPYFETYFGITTDIRLLELADLNHPLLHRLSIEAPGTYHHTITVASLAVAAAENIGANPLLARVGAYYHDVGKVTRPHFFYENVRMKEGDDYHSRVSPNLSSMIIISHVKDGVELARIFRLPQVVIDIIAQHHGTSLIAYFYRKALLEKKGKEPVNESDFRYPGPKPRTKEAAIVMLADSVEADFRFSSGKSSKEIKERVQKVIDNKLKDHQLDEADLSLRDLNLIAEAFVRVLTGLSHTRKRYPEEMLDEGKRKGRNKQHVGEKSS
ncbi:HDIG domain-containing protein [Candidatus Aerophobetes bacterium]|nr:HDIG domain-containing protein [Candidatus Aerophobetes bacterium]